MVADTEQAMDAPPKTRVFISYSRKDMAFADRLEAALKARGFEPLIDRTEIYAFEDWWQRLQALITRADTVVFVLSPDSIASREALKEVEYAASLNKRFAPIVCRRVEDGAVPEALRRLNFIFFDNLDRFEASTDQLAEALRTDIDWIRKHTEFGEAARHWSTAGRPGGLLLRSPDLEEAERWIASRPHAAPEPTLETREFVSESRHDAKRRMLRTRAMLIGLVVVAIATIAAWRNQDWLSTQFYLTGVRALTAEQERTLKPGDKFTECTGCPEMVVLAAGSFVMGSPASENGHSEAEEPQHRVTIARPFAVSKFELTFAQWDACATHGDCSRGITDGGHGRGHQPVINVTWDDAQRYVAWLSKITGKSYRLLSEAEYEYAARAGTQTAYPWGDAIGNNNANCSGCGGQGDGPVPVGSFPPNQFGLFDMLGNVRTWVADCLHFDYKGAPADGSAWVQDCALDEDRMVRGGSWLFFADLIRSAARQDVPTSIHSTDLGFRVGRTLLAP